MSTAFVGLPSSGPGCAYATDIDQEGCVAAPTNHLIVVCPAWGLVSLKSCGKHVAIARASGTVVDEHPYQVRCEEGTCRP